VSEPTVGIRQAAATGVFWTASSQGLRQVITIAIMAVLARYVAPADFGLIAMAAVALGATAPLNELGLGAALIQKREIDSSHAGTVFWTQVLAALVMAGLLTAGAPLVAAFFGREDLTTLLRVMCWSLPLGAACAAPQALLMRAMKFGHLAMVETICMAAAGLTAAALAMAGFGVWSLVAQTLTGSALTAAIVIPLSGLRPLSSGARPRVARIRELSGFSAPLTGYQILNFASRNLDDILIGRYLGATALGYYAMAYRVMMYPLQKVSGVVGRVAFPAFSSLQEDLPRMRRSYLMSVQFIALITFPMMAAVMVVAPEMTNVLFGPGWGPVAPLVIVLALAGMAGSIGTTVGSLFLARGRSDLMLRWEIAASACYLTAIGVGLRWGLMGVAISYTATALILWPVSHLIANRLIELPVRQLFAALAGPAGLALVVAAALLGVRLIWGDAAAGAPAEFLVSCAVVGALLYGLAALARVPRAFGEMLGLARETMAGIHHA